MTKSTDSPTTTEPPNFNLNESELAVWKEAGFQVKKLTQLLLRALYELKELEEMYDRLDDDFDELDRIHRACG
jgi:hypothetical protein